MQIESSNWSKCLHLQYVILYMSGIFFLPLILGLYCISFLIIRRFFLYLLLPFLLSVGWGPAYNFFSFWSCNIVSPSMIGLLNLYFHLYVLEWPSISHCWNCICSAEVIRDHKTGDSLCYAFIGEFVLMELRVTSKTVTVGQTLPFGYVW